MTTKTLIEIAVGYANIDLHNNGQIRYYMTVPDIEGFFDFEGETTLTEILNKAKKMVHDYLAAHQDIDGFCGGLRTINELSTEEAYANYMWVKLPVNIDDIPLEKFQKISLTRSVWNALEKRAEQCGTDVCSILSQLISNQFK